MDLTPHIFVDEIAATAQVRDSANETLFVFDPPYARVLFAAKMNKGNPSLQLPEHKPPGEWERSYDIGDTLQKRRPCSDYGCYTDIGCEDASGGDCGLCLLGHVDNECAVGRPNGVGQCYHHVTCKRKVDLPKEDGETDAAYYQRMDKLHWS